MPTICMFLGIIIRMYRDEHNPPHFHAFYQDYEAAFNAEGELIEGKMPPRQTKFIVAWAELHKEEIIANWELALAKEPLFRIDPLK